MSNKYPSIPECSLDPRSMQNTINVLKEAVELLSGQRGEKPVTWADLVRLGIVETGDVPK